jgi:DNA-directed RNA polymerase alpha subunit
MERPDPEMALLQRNIQHWDAKRCKLLASWLRQRIKILEIDKKLFRTTIQKLHLSARAANVLRFNNICTVGQLLTKATNWDDIRVMKGAGEKVVKELEKKVAEIREGKIE